ncbi:MAG TPA: peptidoglycan DD-metalloendopeptidase family protein [Caulobacterales bacterium]|nr:peptidoglycan DD-metalloendopeptidase family protein [Caulobacterales bacterium]
MSQFGTRARAFFDRVFPERQIYHRSGGTVRYVALSPSKQALLALGAVGVAGWCSYASVNVLMRGQILSSQTDESSRLEAKYKRWLSEARARESAAQAQLKERTETFNKATVEFERRHETLKLLLDFAGGSNVVADTRPVERDGAKLLVQASIEEAEPRVSREWDEPAYKVQTVGFKARVDKLKNEQTAFLSAAEEAAVSRSEEIQGVLRATGVGYARLVDDAANQGGPLVPIDLSTVLGQEGQVDPAFSDRVKQVAARVAEARRLDAIAGATPLNPPLAVEFRETSGYGPRVDPFTRRGSFHAGLDMAAFERAPVVATSPGVVSFAGVRSGYGNCVEIDHGHGFKTRYGHLRDIQVVKGERVAIGQRVGSMGSTGRSTGTHLHYEVWYRGMSYDPIKFLRAGAHVHEQG